VLVKLFPECGVNYMEVGNVLFCCLIMSWRSAATRKVYSALRNAIWADLKKQYGPRLSHPVSKTNQVLPICMPGSSSIHIVTSLVNNRNNIT
jgi:hypothetical protein